jgi:hypothetical protein
MNNTVNTTKLAKFRQARINRIDIRQAARKLSKEDRPLAAMWVDKHAKKTTNREMLKKVGYIVEDISEDNFDNVVEALKCIGVTIVIKSSRFHAIKTLASIIDEEIPECWGGADVQEFVEIV